MYNNNLPAVKNNNGITDKIKWFFKVICRNDISVSGKKEYFKLPVIAFLFISLAAAELAIPAIIISLFCGIEYTVSGQDFITQKTLSFKANR